MIQNQIHEAIVNNCEVVSKWYKSKAERLAFPFYTSFDVRDSGFIVAPVDANIYPAGFNNICDVDKEHVVDIVKSYIEKHYPEVKKNIGLITEEHTGNAYYWENVRSIKKMIEAAGYSVSLAIPRDLAAPMEVISSSGEKLLVHSAKRIGSTVEINGVTPELLISNNDFSEAYEAWAEGLHTPINPPRELGWYRRKKSIYFETYNSIVDEFSSMIGLSSSVMRVETELFSDFDASDDTQREKLATSVDNMIEKLSEKYAKNNIKSKPFVFVKNNAGTYGLGVIAVQSGDDVRTWNYKSKKKMKAAKGGRDVDEVIIQEGIPTTMKSENRTAEPCIYMIGCELAGGFLRTHAEKGEFDSLNSPGAVYKRLCMSDLLVKQSDCPNENVYGWAARLGVLSVATEAEKIGAMFSGYKITGCG